MLKNDGHLDLVRLQSYDRAAQVFAIFYDKEQAPEEGLFFVCRTQQQLFAAQTERYAQLVTHCRTGAEAAAANAGGRIAALLSVEGAELLDCDPGKLEWAQEVGVRCINLTWNHDNLLSGSHMCRPEQGLSDLGRAFVAEAERRDILVDVSHLSDAGFWEVIKIARKPVIATHSNARAVCGHSRNLTDDMFRAVVETGGTVGINFWVKFVRDDVEEPSLEDVVRHIDHFMELGGAKHLALGADLDGCERLAGGMAGVQDMPLLWRALSDHGYSCAELEDLFYNNLARVLG